MLAAEARRDRPLLERIVERRLALEEVAHRQRDGADEFLQEQRSGRLAQSHGLVLIAAPAPIRPIAGRPPRSPPWQARAAGRPSSPAASTDRSDSAARTPSPRQT